jgi:hypothetical protein
MISGRILAAAAAQEDSVAEQAAAGADCLASGSGLGASWAGEDEVRKQKNSEVMMKSRGRITLHLRRSSPNREGVGDRAGRSITEKVPAFGRFSLLRDRRRRYVVAGLIEWRA